MKKILIPPAGTVAPCELARQVAQRAILTDPPAGHFRVVNLYVDASTGRLVVEYDDTPQEG